MCGWITSLDQKLMNVEFFFRKPLAMRWRTKWRWKERNGKTSMPLPQRERPGALGCCNTLTFWVQPPKWFRLIMPLCIPAVWRVRAWEVWSLTQNGTTCGRLTDRCRLCLGVLQLPCLQVSCLMHPESLGDEAIKRSDFSIFALKDFEGLRLKNRKMTTDRVSERPSSSIPLLSGGQRRSERWDKGRDQRWRCERWVEAREARNHWSHLPSHWRMGMLQLLALLSGRAPKRKRRRTVKQSWRSLMMFNETYFCGCSLGEQSQTLRASS